MRDVARSLGAALSAGLRWWGGELKAMVPARLRRMLDDMDGRLVLAAPAAGPLELVYEAGGRRELLARFPASATARKLLGTAASTRPVMLDPVNAEAGTLSDLFFMKHGLEHYDVPAEFADFGTIGCRVFEDDESRRIAQIWAAEKRMQFFLFPAERDSKTGAVMRFPGWRYVHQEGWTGAVTEHSGVCFMAAIRGRDKDLEPYIARPKE